MGITLYYLSLWAFATVFLQLSVRLSIDKLNNTMLEKIVFLLNYIDMRLNDKKRAAYVS